MKFCNQLRNMQHCNWLLTHYSNNQRRKNPTPRENKFHTHYKPETTAKVIMCRQRQFPTTTHTKAMLENDESRMSENLSYLRHHSCCFVPEKQQRLAVIRYVTSNWMRIFRLCTQSKYKNVKTVRYKFIGPKMQHDPFELPVLGWYQRAHNV